MSNRDDDRSAQSSTRWLENVHAANCIQNTQLTDNNAADYAICMKASPRKVKTQTAKITYTSNQQYVYTDAAPKRKCNSTTTPTHSPVRELSATAASTPNSTDTFSVRSSNSCTQLQHEEIQFQRDKELQSTVNEMCVQKPVQKSQQQAYSDMCRSHTDLNMKVDAVKLGRQSRMITREGSARQRATSLPQTTNTKSGAESNRHYDMQTVRQYMAQQRRVRRQMLTNADKKNQQTDMIQKRLEALKQNTKRIINDHFNKRLAKTEVRRRPLTQPKDTSNLQIHDGIVENAKAAVENAKMAVEKATKAPMWVKSKHVLSAHSSKANIAAATAPTHKRIGLLRKPATENNSFSAIKDFSFEKENVALQMLTPQLPQQVAVMEIPPAEPMPVQRAATAQMQCVKNKAPQKELLFKARNCASAADLTDRNEPIKLNTTNERKQQKATRVAPTNENKTAEDAASITNWLQPCSAHIYPYNFIYAVRRKLDAIVNTDTQLPLLATECTDANQQSSQATSTRDLVVVPEETPLSTVPKQCLTLAQENLKRRLMQETSFTENALEMQEMSKKKTQWKKMQQNLIDIADLQQKQEKVELPQTTRWVQTEEQPQRTSLETIPSVSNIKSTSIEANSKSKPTAKSLHSELHSNQSYSSISLQLPPTNSSSALSSPKRSKNKYIEASRQLSAAIEEDDTTTMSSSVFNSTSQELSLPKPVATTSTCKRHLNAAIAKSHINPLRGDNDVDTKANDTSHLVQRINDVHVDFSKMLEDFNRNLSQVLEVNDQLKRSVIESHKVSNDSYNSTALSQTLEEQKYTTDFDASSSTLKQPTQSNENTNHTSTPQAVRSNRHTAACGFECSEQAHAKQLDALEEMAAYFKRSLTASIDNKKLSDDQTEQPTVASSCKLTANTGNAASVSATVNSISEHILHDSISQQNNSQNKQLNQTFTTIAKSSMPEKEHNLVELYVNTARGDFDLSQRQQDGVRAEINAKSSACRKLLTDGDKSDDSACSSTALPTYSAAAVDFSKRKYCPSRNISGEIASLFKQTEKELSAINASLSESSINFSNVGLYEQLIKQETYKTEQLVNLLKIREKSIMDRAKGQIAWLEVQKERYKAKGLTNEISTIKKKQRAVLMKMEKQREEVKRLLQTTTSTTTVSSAAPQEHSNRKKLHLNSPAVLLPPPVVAHKQQRKTKTITTTATTAADSPRTSTSAIIRARYDLESSRSLEELLRKRESDLRRRREQVERLMQWHRRLEQEEAEVMHLEHALLDYNNGHSPNRKQKETQRSSSSSGSKVRRRTKRTSEAEAEATDISSEQSQKTQRQRQHQQQQRQRTLKMERRIKDIDKSLRELSSISSANNNNSNSNSNSNNSNLNDVAAAEAAVETGSNNLDYVRTSGSKLNKLWRRLTSQQLEKFEPNRRYKLCKSDLERLYEDAKLAVLQDFAQDEKRTATELLERNSNNVSVSDSCNSLHSVNTRIDVPSLDLSQSASVDDCSRSCSQNETLTDPCSINSAVSSARQSEANGKNRNAATAATADKEQVNRNLQLYLAITQRLMANSMGIQRSLSDTQIPTLQQSLTLLRNAVSQRSINLAQQCVVSPKIKRSNGSNSDSGSIGSHSSYSTQKSANTLSWVQSLQTQAQTVADDNSSANDLAANIPQTKSNNNANNSDDSGSSKNSVTSPIIETADSKSTSAAIETIAELTSNEAASTQASEDINTKLSDISAAVTLLSQANSLPPSYRSTKTFTATLSRYDRPMPSEETTNLSVNSELSYSAQFEQINSEMHSTTDSGTSGTLFKSKSTELNNNQSKTLTPFADVYEADFETLSDVTNIADISQPPYDTTLDTTQTTQHDEEAELANVQSNKNPPLYREDTTTLLNVEESALAPTSPPPPPSPSTTAEEGSTHTIGMVLISNSQMANSTAQQLMPDIINELEVRRCQQLLMENEQLKQYEHVTAVPYMYMREIPNKPPPPYVPPAHGSPMTTIFPSEERIREITYRRTHELYCEMLKTDYTDDNGDKLPSVMEEKITNIYERIILDICREYLLEHNEVLKQGDPTNFHSQLAFFNPPNRLQCVQESIYKEVRRCLAMDKTPTKRTQVYSIYGQRARRDHIGKIIIQEMYDEDTKWCNFHREESEVLELILEEMIGKEIEEVTNEVLLEKIIPADDDCVEINEEQQKMLNKDASDVEKDIDVEEEEPTSATQSTTSITVEEVSA